MNNMGPGSRQAGPHHLDLLLVQLDAILAVMARAQGTSLADTCRAALEAGVGNTFAVVRDFEARFGDPATAERIAAVRPVIPIDAVARMGDAQRLIVQGLGDRIRDGVAGELAQSIAQGEGIAKATRRLRTWLDKQDWQLQRIARTEINNAMNAGHEAGIAQAAATFPELGLKKQWSAHLDNRTSAICRHLDGDVVDADDAFEAMGWRGQYPPAHVNCRSRVVPWTDRWGGKQQRTAAEKAAQELAYLQGRKQGAKRGRPPAAPKPPEPAPATSKPKAKSAPAPATPKPKAKPPTPKAPPIITGGPAVGLALPIQTTDKTSRAGSRALAVIDGVHGDGVLPPIDFKVTRKRDTWGGYCYGVTTGKAYHVELSSKGPQPELTMAHEVGHFLDHQGIGAPGRYASTETGPLRHPAMGAVMDAITGSQAHAQLSAWRGQKRISWPDSQGVPAWYGVNPGHVDYLLKREELWARAYAQYVATRSQDPAMLAQLEVTRTEPGPFQLRQWSHEDFKPIGEAIDRLMESQGWNRTTPTP